MRSALSGRVPHLHLRPGPRALSPRLAWEMPVAEEAVTFSVCVICPAGAFAVRVGAGDSHGWETETRPHCCGALKVMPLWCELCLYHGWDERMASPKAM